MDEHAEPQLSVYWQPGCSSCLKCKELLIEQGIPFRSVNVNEDPDGMAELAALGLRMVPIVARGSDWANGAVFRDVARVAGFQWKTEDMLTPEALVERVDRIVAAARRLAAQLPEESLDTLLPGRPRTYRQLAFHIIRIPEVFLDRVERDAPYTYEALLDHMPDEVMSSRQGLLDYGTRIRQRFADWWRRDGRTMDFTQPGRVYYGEVSLHEVLERTAWHSGHHTRQLQLTLKVLGLEPDAPLEDDDFEGLPMPANVWDNETTFTDPTDGPLIASA